MRTNLAGLFLTTIGVGIGIVGEIRDDPSLGYLSVGLVIFAAFLVLAKPNK